MLKDGWLSRIVAALQGYNNDIDRIVALIALGNGAKGSAVKAEATKDCDSWRL